jgi:hypothetical protein
MLCPLLICLINWYRLLGFGACLLGAAACFFVAFLTLPMLALRPGKFALAFRWAIYGFLVEPSDVLDSQSGFYTRHVWVSRKI